MYQVIVYAVIEIATGFSREVLERGHCSLKKEIVGIRVE